MVPTLHGGGKGEPTLVPFREQGMGIRHSPISLNGMCIIPPRRYLLIVRDCLSFVFC